MDAFAVSVERALDASLGRRAVVIGNEAAGRGLVACACYEARRRGVHAGMPMALARRRAPQAAFLGENQGEYERFSMRVHEILCAHAPVVEAASLDDFYLDLSGCQRLYGGDLLEWARRLKRTVAKETRLPVSLGLASNKMLARIATRMAKTQHIVSVFEGMERDFMASVPVELLPGVGEKISSRLRDFGIRKVGELAAMDEQLLRLAFGNLAGELKRRARGEFFEPVKPSALHRFISHEQLFGEDVASPEVLEAAAVLLAEKLASDLRRHGVRAAQAEAMLRYSDHLRVSHQICLEYPSDQDADFIPAVRKAVLGLFTRRVRVRWLGLRAPFVPNGDSQFDFFEERGQQKRKDLYQAIDQIRARHGFGALTRARSVLAK